MGDFLSILGNSMSGPGGMTANWGQPSGAGLGYSESPMLPQHQSGILQSILGDTSSPVQSGGLAALLMHLGILR